LGRGFGRMRWLNLSWTTLNSQNVYMPMRGRGFGRMRWLRYYRR
jgi:hypothetical protein